ncbi:LIM/homeobox protein Lhx9-like isoform X2 [Daktulosphaira vitifoliae]|uniref:LIM/homeobox protein Lhx9-like isoform X2 n=1 Tax=Daktulosphaira vitifoliae TaxID=58002 RepID=UPI0021AADD74|nr:LIM/homeobox protein Lhx9-like isoform X2 [Daktulosphaira vitifoliae]
MGVFEDLANQKPGMHWHDRHHMLVNPYDPSRDQSPNLPTTPCREQEQLTSVYGGHGQCCAFKSEFDDDCPDCKVPPPPTASTVLGNSYRSGSLEMSCKLERDCAFQGSSPGTGYGSPEPSSPSVSYTYESPDMMVAPKQEEPEVNLCDGCGQKILERYYLFAVEKRWHASCLQCSQCSQTLAGELKCFYRDGNIYCKSDYQRLHGIRRCGRCQAAISPTDLVMRARDTVFHVSCFSCVVCMTVLTKGDHFGMRDGAVFCQHHYQQLEPPTLVPLRTISSIPTPSQSPYPSSNRGLGPDAAGTAVGGFFNGGVGNGSGVAVGATVASTQPRQKGRPRKRKPKDLDAITANLDMNSSDSYNMEMTFGPNGLTSGTGGTGGSGHQRTKRMRTSFKHHQLRTMKSYFHHNHNPDAKDLKQLSQKTGLPKRVLQVWFQNARAKYRRTSSKQDGLGNGQLSAPSSIKPDKSCSESSNGSTGIEAVMYHQQQQHGSIQMSSPHSYISTSSPMECGS